MCPDRIRSVPAFLAAFVVLCIVGMRDTPHSDRADEALLVYRNSPARGRADGLKYMSPTGTTPPLSTGTSSSPSPSETCYNPSLSVPWTEVDENELCKCDSYSTTSPDYNAGVAYDGEVRCWYTLFPLNPNQTKIVDSNEDFQSCMGACAGSFEKAKRAAAEGGIDARVSEDEYWFCHGVNFKQGELCEFVGQITRSKYTPGTNYWDTGLTRWETG